MPKKKETHETTITFTAEVTMIKKGQLDDVLPPELTEQRIKTIEDTIKEELGADDIKISNFKIFVN